MSVVRQLATCGRLLINRRLAVSRTLSVNISSRKSGDRIGETSVFIQNGTKISELPVIVKKVKDVFELYRRIGINPKNTTNLTPQTNDKLVISAPNVLCDDEREIIDGFSRCYNSSSIFRLLETIPQDEVTPPVAAYALRKIIDLESDNTIVTSKHRDTIRGPVKKPDSFLRIAFITTLLDIVCGSKDPVVILDGLSSVMRDQFPGDQAAYKERLLEQVLLCVSDGIFSLQQICQAVNILSLFYDDKKKCLETADKLWFGIMNLNSQLNNAEDIVAVFSTLPHLNKSRNIVLKLLEERAVEHWQMLNTGDMIEIMRVLTEIKYERLSGVFLRMLSGWLSLNIHTVSDQQMLAMIWGFHLLDYTDQAIIRAMEKIIKHKGCQISELDLIYVMCSYCTKFRIRSPTILEGVGQYFIEHHHNMEPVHIMAIAQSFGQMDFHPPNGFRFWEILETQLEMKFSQFPPKDMVNLLVSFLYIEKYPLNFVNKIFNPFFIDRLHNQPDSDVSHSRQQLKLLDTGMHLESRGYQGPFLPKDTNYKSINHDSRISRLAGKLLNPLSDVVGDISRLGKQVVLASLPLHPLYIVDIMIYPSHAASLLRFGFRTNNSSNVAVLVMSPEHYDRTGSHLLGPQALRIRHLKLMGFKVMLINMNTANKLMMSPGSLREYLQKLYLETLNA